MGFWVVIFLICVVNLLTEYIMVRDTQIGQFNNVKSSKSQKTLNLILIAILAIVAGLRNVGGTDFNVYRKVFEGAPSLSAFFEDYDVLDDKYQTYGVERLYLFSNTFLKSLGFSYYGFIFIHSLFIIFVTYFALRKYTSEFTIVIFVFLYKFYFYNVFISLRQPITIALFFIMLRFMEKHKWKQYFLMCIVCFMFHSAALVLFPVYFLNRLKLSKRLVVILNFIFIPTLILSELNVPVLKLLDPILEWDIFSTDEAFNKADTLINGISSNSINWLHTAEYFLFMALIIMFFDEIIKVHPDAETMIKLFLCLLPIFTLFRNYEILTRIKDYFTLSYGFIISYFCMIRNGRMRELIYLVLVAWCGLGFFRFISLFDGGAMLSYMPNIFLGRSFFN